jgi:hypothetical protein
MEKLTVEGDSPVNEIMKKVGGILSTAGQVESCGNQRRPRRKTKYSFVTDSELVP